MGADVCAVCGSSGNSVDGVASLLEDELSDVNTLVLRLIVLTVPYASVWLDAETAWACVILQKKHSNRNIFIELRECAFIFIVMFAVVHLL